MNPADDLPAEVDFSHGTGGQFHKADQRLRLPVSQNDPYHQWLAAEIQSAIDDPRPNLSHDQVMADLDADIAALLSTRP